MCTFVHITDGATEHVRDDVSFSANGMEDEGPVS